jgi:hypothetical protein
MSFYLLLLLLFFGATKTAFLQWAAPLFPAPQSEIPEQKTSNKKIP